MNQYSLETKYSRKRRTIYTEQK